MLEQVYESVGNFGKIRVKLLKENFRSIIDNIIPPDFKAFMAWTKWYPLDKLIEFSTQNSSEPINFNKRFKINENNEIGILLNDIKYSNEFGKMMRQFGKRAIEDFK